MKRRIVTAMLVGQLVVAAVATADTLHFKDGSTLDGRVSHPNPNVYVLEVEGGRLYFQTSEVDRVEENDKEGKGRVYVGGVKQQEHEAMRQSMTGLTAEQIEQAYRIMEPLSSPDPNEVSKAKERLMAMNEQVDIVRFLEAAARDMSERSLPAVMEVLVELDPERAKNTLTSKSTDPATGNRAKALQLLGKTADEKDIETISRGMVDEVPEVQIAAAEGLAEAGDKRATPALILGLQSNDTKVRNASAAALERIWESKPGEDAASWQRFWSNQASTVKGAVVTGGLEPLVSKEELDMGLQHHE